MGGSRLSVLRVACVLAGALGAISIGVAHAQQEPAPASAGAQELVEAVRVGDLGRVRALLLAGEDPNERDARSWTALTYAAMGGQVEIANALIEAGADVNARTADGSTPLMAAAVMGHTDLARALIERGADPQLRNEAGADARLKAEQYEHPELAEILGPSAPARAPEAQDPSASAATAPSGADGDPGPFGETHAELAVSPPSGAEVQPEPVLPSEGADEGAPEPDAEAAPSLPVTVTELVVLKDAIVRASPGLEGERIGALARGKSVRVREKVRDWYAIEYEEDTAYVYERLLGEDLPDPAPAPPESETDDLEETWVSRWFLSGRWATADNPHQCTRDFLDVRVRDEQVSLIVHAAGRVTVLAEDLPILDVEDGRVEAGTENIRWSFEATARKLAYRAGSAKEVTYRRCPEGR